MGYKRLTASSICLSVMLILSMINHSPALIACRPNICESVECPEIKEEDCPPPTSYIKPNGGFCGCCDKCITTLGEGERCLHFIGVPPTTECGAGLICKDSTCQKLSLNIEQNI